jgi:Cyclin D1 binding domain
MKNKGVVKMLLLVARSGVELASNERSIGVNIVGRFALWVSLLVITSTLVACVSTQFHPRSAVPEAQVTARAVEFHEDDIRTLAAVGGRVVGTIFAQGSGFHFWPDWASSDDGSLDASAAREAAQAGGTHIILSSRGEDYFNVTFAGSSSTNCTGYGGSVNCTSTYNPPRTQTVSKPRAEYVVVRVPPQNWADLPGALRPTAIVGLVIPAKPAAPAPQATGAPAATARPVAAPAPGNLTGVWVGAYAPERLETIRIEHVGSHVEATKITGDTNVPAGKPTFRADMNGNLGEGMGHGADPGYQNPRWYPGELRVLSDNEIEFTWILEAGRSSVRFTRQSDATYVQ